MNKGLLTCATLALSLNACPGQGVHLDGGAGDVRDGSAGDVTLDAVSLDTTQGDAPVTDASLDAGGDDAASLTPVPYVPPGSVRFESAGRDGDFLKVNVVGRDLGLVFGIAMRIRWDPGSMEIGDGTQVAAALGDGGIYKYAMLRPGDLAVVLSLKGPGAAKDLTGDQVLATLYLKPAGETQLSFFRGRSLVLGPDLSRPDVTWLDAKVSP